MLYAGGVFTQVGSSYRSNLASFVQTDTTPDAPASKQQQSTPGGGGSDGFLGETKSSCIAPTGSLSGQKIGRFSLRRTRAANRRGLRRSQRRPGDGVCFRGGGHLRIFYMSETAFAKLAQAARHASHAVLILTSSRFYSARGISHGTPVATLRKAFSRAWSVRIGKNRWYIARGRRAEIVVKTRHRRVVSIGIADKRAFRTHREGRAFLKSFSRRAR
jgi:hypothetical protein